MKRVNYARALFDTITHCFGTPEIIRQTIIYRLSKLAHFRNSRDSHFRCVRINANDYSLLHCYTASRAMHSQRTSNAEMQRVQLLGQSSRQPRNVEIRITNGKSQMANQMTNHSQVFFRVLLHFRDAWEIRTAPTLDIARCTRRKIRIGESSKLTERSIAIFRVSLAI